MKTFNILAGTVVHFSRYNQSKAAKRQRVIELLK